MKKLSYGKKTGKNGGDPFVIRGEKRPDSKLNTVYRPKWSEDAFLADNQDKETVGKNFNFRALPYMAFFLLGFLLLILGKTAWLQIAKGEHYYRLSEGNRIRIERLEPKRGIIYDRNGLPLVRNKANFTLYCIPSDLPEEAGEREGIFDRIYATVPEMDREKFKSELAKVDPKNLEFYRPLFMADGIPYEQAVKLKLESENWPGIVVANKTNRDYLIYGNAQSATSSGARHSLSHIIGYTGKISPDELEEYGGEYLPIDYIGKMGIEYFWENELKGQSGKKSIEVDALGKEKKIIQQVPPEDGNNLVLSIDTAQQLKLEEILGRHLEELGLSRGAAILLDPRNGEVMAMVSLPAYDNNAFARGIGAEEYGALISHPDKPLYNRAVSGEYPSGSIIKPVWAAAALEERIVSENTSFLSTGGIRIGQWFFPDWLAGGHGRVSVRRAIAQSVNTYFYYIGGGHDDFTGLGVDRMVHYGKLFGLGSQTGIDLAGEADGFLPTKDWKREVKGENWYIGDTYHMAIGQGDLLVTPLQAALFTSVFANGGQLYRPHFVRQVLSGDDEPLGKVENEPVRENFISPYNIHVVRQGMRQTVTEGSARSLQAVPAEVAGKTGTAQWSSQHDTHAWFTGFAPYDDAELAITVLLEQGGEGSDTAVPVAREYLQWYFGEYKAGSAGD